MSELVTNISNICSKHLLTAKGTCNRPARFTLVPKMQRLHGWQLEDDTLTLRWKWGTLDCQLYSSNSSVVHWWNSLSKPNWVWFLKNQGFRCPLNSWTKSFTRIIYHISISFYISISRNQYQCSTIPTVKCCASSGKPGRVFHIKFITTWTTTELETRVKPKSWKPHRWTCDRCGR